MKKTNSASTFYRIKHCVLAFILLTLSLSWIPARAQIENQNDSTATENDTTLRYLDLWEYAFMMHEETSWLFKLSIPVVTNPAINNIKLGFETKIAQSFSINFEAGFYNNYDRYDSMTFSFSGWNVALEGRWYYRMKKRIREEKLAKNMSDNYIALGISYNHPISYYSENKLNSINLYAKWGFQRRFLEIGLVDFGARAGVSFLINRPDIPVFSFSNFVNVGFGFTKDKYKLDKKQLCPILKCYDSDKYIFKSNLSGIIGINFTKYSSTALFAPHIGFEYKLGKSPLSINTEIRTAIQFTNIKYDGIFHQAWFFDVNYLLEGRWYYNLRKRMRNGKSGNGLSASYIAIGGRLRYSYRSFNPVNDFHKFIQLKVGWQRLFSKHLYYDFSVGVGYRFPEKNYSGEFSVPINIAVGYRF